MAKTILTTDPVRADHRMIHYVLQTHFKKKRIQTEVGSFSKVSEVFEKMNGSWIGLFGGGTEDFTLLKRVLKTAIKIGVLRPKPKVE